MTRLLTILGATGDVVRGHNAGHWRISRPLWTSMTSWLGEPMTPEEPAAGYAEVVRRWLWTFGPGTEPDLVWWLGSTKAAVRTRCRPRRGRRSRSRTGRPGGCCPTTPPTWRRRRGRPVGRAAADPRPDDDGLAAAAFYLDPPTRRTCSTRPATAERRCGSNGRIVGCWVQDDDERVRLVLMEEITRRRCGGSSMPKSPASTSSCAASTSRTCSPHRR